MFKIIMNCIFRNPNTRKLEVGAICKVHLTKQGKKYDIISESGIEYPILTENKKKAGYVDMDLTKKLLPKIADTKLSRSTRGNFKNLFITEEIIEEEDEDED